MKKLALAALLPLGLLAACGSADDASTAAEADTVEMPADDAMAGVTAEPAADPNANATEDAADASEAATATAEEAGANAADVAARAQEAAAAADAATETPQ